MLFRSVILGHTRCGAVTAVTEAALDKSKNTLEKNTASLLRPIITPVQQQIHNYPDVHGDALIESAIKQNVYQGIGNLLGLSPTTRRLVLARTVKIVGGVYNVDTGEIGWFNDNDGVNSWSFTVAGQYEARPDTPKEEFASIITG